MSCNGCRVLRKGCRSDCILRDSLTWIQNPQAQSHATLFVAKFFGRATLMSCLSSVPSNRRSDLFRSLMYEGVGRTINPVYGAVGLLWTGKWQLCQLGVDQVLRGNAAALITPLQRQLLVDDDLDQISSDKESSSTYRPLMIMEDNDYIRQEQQSGSIMSHRVVVDSGQSCKRENKTSSEEELESSTLGSTSGVGETEGCCVNASQTQRNQPLTLFF